MCSSSPAPSAAWSGLGRYALTGTTEVLAPPGRLLYQVSLGSALSWEEDFCLEVTLKDPVILPLGTAPHTWSSMAVPWSDSSHKLLLLSGAKLSAMETNTHNTPRTGFLCPVPCRTLAVCNGTA